MPGRSNSVSMIVKPLFLACCASLSLSACATAAPIAPQSALFGEIEPHAQIAVTPLDLRVPAAESCSPPAADCIQFSGAAGEALLASIDAAETNTAVLAEVLAAHNALATEADILAFQAQGLEASYNRVGQLLAEAEAHRREADRWRTVDGWVTRVALVGALALAADN